MNINTYIFEKPLNLQVPPSPETRNDNDCSFWLIMVLLKTLFRLTPGGSYVGASLIVFLNIYG
jgi:hypothetical protein